MKQEFARSLDDFRLQSWVDFFPWLETITAPGSDDDRWCASVGETGQTMREAYLAEISELAVERFARRSLGWIIPKLASGVDLYEVDFPVRAINVLERFDCSLSDQLLLVTINEMLDWPQIGIGTVKAIVRSLAEVSISETTQLVLSTDPLSGEDPEAALEASRVRENAMAALEDLGTLASWYAIIGRNNHPLLSSVHDAGAPPNVMEAWDRLHGLDASDVLTQSALEVDVARLFDDQFALMDPRGVRVLAERLFADEPNTLDHLTRATCLSDLL